jgi:uncharacterized protein (TIGR02284 family)
MSTTQDHDIKVLNGLIETTLDSADGYREAAKETEDSRYKSVFEKRSFERAQVATDLQGSVRQLGGEPEDDGSILAKAHRAFLDIKHALIKDEQAVVNSVENGEDHIKAKFERALEDSDVSATTKETIRRAYDSVKTGHDQMRDLKHALENTNGVNPAPPRAH